MRLGKTKRVIGLLLAVAMMVAVVGATADSYYFGSKDVALWGNPHYTLTVDRRLELTGSELKKGNEVLIEYGRIFYPLDNDSKSVEAYLVSFACNVLRWEPSEVTYLHISGAQAYAMKTMGNGLANHQHLILVNTGNEIIWFFSGLPMEDFLRIVSTLKFS